VAKQSKPTPPRFILQYELDSDPFELFATEKEVRAASRNWPNATT
jgi:hypothetical protein